MKIHLKALKLINKASEELFDFAENITFVHGTLSLGKSTVARLVDFCFGGRLEQTTAIQREFLAAQLSLVIGGNDVLIERSREESYLTVTWRDATGSASTVTIRAKGDGPPVLGDDIVNLSDLLFYLLGYPIIRVRKRSGDDESPMVRLSFRDLLKFCYLEQEELDSSFFRLNTPVLAEKSKDALNFFTGYYSETLSALETKLDQLRRDQRAKREAAERIKEFLAQFGFASDGQVQTELDEVLARAQQQQDFLNSDRATYTSATHFVDDQRQHLRLLSNGLSEERDALQAIDEQLEDQRQLRAELISMKFKTARADSARSVLEGSAFDYCPNCGESVSTHRSRPAGACYLCLQLPTPHPERDIDASTIRGDLDARLADLDASLRRHQAARKQQEKRIADLTAQKAKLDSDVAQLLTSYESDRLARTRDAERQSAELQERARFLRRVQAMPDAVTTMLEEADAISADLERTSRLIRDEQQRLSYADENFAALERNFLEALLAVRVPGVSGSDKVHMNRRTLIPDIWPAGLERQAYNFFNSGSGGKKTLITICFALALHRTAALRNMPVPTLLIIDTPLKNITPDINPELVTAFYEYLYQVAARDLPSHQIVVIDQLLVAPPADSELAFRSQRMTEDDPDAPPLISYYRGP